MNLLSTLIVKWILVGGASVLFFIDTQAMSVDDDGSVKVWVSFCCSVTQFRLLDCLFLCYCDQNTTQNSPHSISLRVILLHFFRFAHQWVSLMKLHVKCSVCIQKNSIISCRNKDKLLEIWCAVRFELLHHCQTVSSCGRVFVAMWYTGFHYVSWNEGKKLWSHFNWQNK